MAAICATACHAKPSNSDGSVRAPKASSDDRNGLILSIEVNAASSETVAHVVLKNNGPTPIWTNIHLVENVPDGHPELGNLHVEVSDDKGSRLPYSCEFGPGMVRPEDFAFLRRGEAVSADILLSGCYPLRHGVTYVATAIYRSTNAWSPPKPDGAIPFWGTLRSTGFRFVIH
jgi:hypothetical protein